MTRWLAVALAVVIAGGLWIGWDKAPGKPEIVVIAPEEAQYYLSGAHYQSYDENGKVLYRVKANQVLYFDNETIRMNAVNVDYVGGESGVWTFTANEGLIPAQERNLLLSGDVVMDGVTPQGRNVTMNTPQIWVRPDEETIETSASVEFISKQATATAIGMKTDLTARQLTLLDDVRVIQNP